MATASTAAMREALASLSDSELLQVSPLDPEASLYDYARLAWPHIESAPFVDNWHIRVICEHLQAVTEGKIKNLLINIPPGCSKSLLVSVMWPTWEWSRDPSKRWFYVSYDQRLSTRDSVKCRTLINSPWYQARWGDRYTMTGDQNQKTYYETSGGGYRLATTIRGHGTGEHPDRIVVDDPHDVTGAESEKERESVFDWWTLTMPSRGASRDVKRVVIMQRLHEADLSGHVLEVGGFEHICLPMRYEADRMPTTSLGFNDPRTEEGELLTPEQFNEETVYELERSLGSYGTAGQLQQRPAPRSGGMFQRDYFRSVKEAPPRHHFKRLVRYWDKAGTEGDGDYTAGPLLGEHQDGRVFVLDVVRGQWSAGRRDDCIDLTAQLDESSYGQRVTIWLEQEPGSGGKQSAEISARRLRGYRVKIERPTGDKVARADALASHAENEGLYVVQAEWTRAYIDELCAFPNGKHDDQVDGSSGAFNKLVRPGKRLLVG